jgi:hypothetical protein
VIEKNCIQLHDIYDKIDGEVPPVSPPDFIVGDPAVLEELREMVLDLTG